MSTPSVRCQRYTFVMETPRQFWPRAAVIASAIWLMLCGVGTQAGPVSEAPAKPGREAVWRAIFARPAEADRPPAPEEQAKIALGYDLFRDGRLSASGHDSCVSCHDPARAFTDGRPKAIGPRGAILQRNAPALYDLAWGKSFFWDGRAPSLAEQARVPILAPDELAGDFPAITRRLSADAAMRARFAEVFPSAQGITETEILEALAAYERSLISPRSRFDRWVEGDDGALTEEELAGFGVFVGKGGCVSCHGGWRFTDDAFHDIGMPGPDRGRGALTPGGQGLPEFKTPSLREVSRTAPYMHDGSLATLKDVVDHYAGDFVVRPSLAPTLVRDLKLTDAEKRALIAFLNALSGKPDAFSGHETTRPTP